MWCNTGFSFFFFFWPRRLGLGYIAQSSGGWLLIGLQMHNNTTVKYSAGFHHHKEHGYQEAKIQTHMGFRAELDHKPEGNTNYSNSTTFDYALANRLIVHFLQIYEALFTFCLPIKRLFLILFILFWTFFSVPLSHLGLNSHSSAPNLG